ncbi:AraC family transcriptional regulator [Fulvivirgaceae bacterium BMA10]|uniref:AraC family transcriptional regulator n=1 Tax=Splendidivirga corallicola TaxID=3051826 RepID=A0ABT8KNV9_9BACT|nr:AraC family transcriptional regulator [Fulvivirgaceae bacterium BMA10]
MTNNTTDTYYERISQAVKFIEENLKNGLSIDSIAQRACYSKYHFIRIFSAMVGESVGDYVRKRRISESSKELISSGKSILNIALDYQFESQEAYTRSFKSIYNTTPGTYRKQGVHQIAFEQKVLSPTRLDHLKNNISLQPNIVEIPVRKLVGIRLKTSKVDNRIPLLWQTFMKRIHEIKYNKNTGRYGLHPYDSELTMESLSETWEFEKWATVEVTDPDQVPEGMETYILQAGKYAVFSHKSGITGIQMSFEYIYGTWLQNSEYQLDARDDFERYGEKFYGHENPDSEVEFWIPIK